MAINVTVARTSRQKIIVSNNGGILQTSRPVTLRNQIVEIRGLDNIPDINATGQTDGASLVYNANTLQYDVRPLTINDISGIIDEGEF